MATVGKVTKNKEKYIVEFESDSDSDSIVGHVISKNDQLLLQLNENPLEEKEITLHIEQSSSKDKSVKNVLIDDGSKWRGSGHSDEYIAFDYGKSVEFNQVYLEYDANRIENCSIYTSDDNESWKRCCNTTCPKKGPYGIMFSATKARYWKFFIHHAHGDKKWIGLNFIRFEFDPMALDSSDSETESESDVSTDTMSTISDPSSIESMSETEQSFEQKAEGEDFKDFLKLINFNTSGLERAKKLYTTGRYAMAMYEFKVYLLNKFRNLDCPDFDRMKDIKHPNNTTWAQSAVGHIKKKHYQNSKRFKFDDIYGITETSYPPKCDEDIDWLASVDKKTLPSMVRYYKWKFCMGFPVNFWYTGNIAYIRKWMSMTAHFCDHHYDQVKDWDKNKFDKFKGFSGVAECRWNDQADTAFGQAKRMMTMIKTIALFCKRDKYIGETDKNAFTVNEKYKDAWETSLRPVAGSVPQECIDAIDTGFLCSILRSLVYDHPLAILDRYGEPGPNSNQAMRGYEALGMVVKYLIPFKHVKNSLQAQTEKLLEMFNTIAFNGDGTMLETSVNYNIGDAEALQSTINLIGKDFPRWSKKTQKLVDDWYTIFHNLHGPTGILPQIGNNKRKEHHTSNMSVVEREIGHGKLMVPSSGSIAYPYGGLFVLRDKGIDPKRVYALFSLMRKNTGHFTHDTCGLQVFAQGRTMLGYAGGSKYGQYANKDMEDVSDYYSESNTAKTNTVLVDGLGQSHWEKAANVGFTQPVEHVWASNDETTFVSGKYRKELGYGTDKKRIIDNVSHERSVVLFHKYGILVVNDEMKAKKKHWYQQVWHVHDSYRDQDVHVKDDHVYTTSTFGNFKMFFIGDDYKIHRYYKQKKPFHAGWFENSGGVELHVAFKSEKLATVIDTRQVVDKITDKIIHLKDGTTISV